MFYLVENKQDDYNFRRSKAESMSYKIGSRKVRFAPLFSPLSNQFLIKMGEISGLLATSGMPAYAGE